MTETSPFKPLGLDHVVLRVTDHPGMERFYCDVLGCHVDRRNEPLGLLQLRAGRSQIDLVDIDGVLGREGGAAAGSEGRNMDHFCIRVDPFEPDAIFAWLDANNVEHQPLKPRYGADGYGFSIYIRDPEGNEVELKGPPDPAAEPKG
ncbi:MAG: VOC family protein [Alphaproteobacteria bacterium]|jgi:glyoxylase I family protein